MADEEYLALYRRYLWENKNIIFVYTNAISKITRARENYNAVHNIARGEAPVITKTLNDMMIAASLAAESQMTREMWGWTIRLPFKKWGIFCGIEPNGSICCRTRKLSADAEKDVIGALAIQRVDDNAPVRQSMLIPRDTQVHLLVEQYFDESEQLPARVAISKDEALLALSMPNAAWSEVEKLSEADLIKKFHELLQDGNVEEVKEIEEEAKQDERLAKVRAQYAKLHSGDALSHGELKCTHEAVFYYDCRCDSQQMHKVIERLPESEQKEVWKGTDHLEIECPRCGRKHTIFKKDASNA